MNIQPSSQFSQEAAPENGGLRLKEIEQATYKAKTGVIVWTLGALATYFMSGRVSDPTSSLMFQASIVSLFATVIYAGRWSLSRQMEGQVKAQRQARAPIDWSTLPEGGFSREIRFFASLEEAQERGWKMGPAGGVINAKAIPQWIEMGGDRFLFDGLTRPQGVSFVPENVRVMGQLRFVKTEVDASEAEVSPTAVTDPVVLGEGKPI